MFIKSEDIALNKKTMLKKRGGNMEKIENESMKPMTDWLNEYSKPNVRSQNKSAFQIYLNWIQKSPKALIAEFEQAQTRNEILRFQNYLVNEYVSPHTKQKLKANSIRAILTSVRAFYSSQKEEVRGLKNKILDAEMAHGQHCFSLDDFKKIYAIGNTEEKAIIALGVSLGWESSSFLNLDKQFIENLVNRAKSQNTEFISFDWQRVKEMKPQFGILNPIALYALGEYLAQLNKKSPNQAKLFDFDEKTLNNILKRLCEDANLVLTGSVSFHLIRKFVMDTLSDSGLNSFEVKLVLGKSIGISDLTYLRTLKNSAFEKYKKAYATHFSLMLNVNGKAIYNELVDLTVKTVKAQSDLVDFLKSKGLMREIPTNLQEELEEIKIFAQAMSKKNGKKEEPKEEPKTEQEG